MLLDFFNANSGAFSVLFAGIVALATLVYAILTWKLVSETKRMREAQTEPKISISIQPREESINMVDIIIQNIGLGPAYNIAFELDGDFYFFKDRLFSDIGFIKKGIKYLAPNQKKQSFLTSMTENYEEKQEISIGIDVNYKNSSGKAYYDNYTINFSELKGLLQLGTPPLHAMARNIEKIKDDIHHITTGFHKPKIVIYTKKEVEEEERAMLEQYEETKKSMEEK